MRCAFTLLALLATAPSTVAQTTWYVDVNGTPPGSGTQNDPYTSIQFAITQPNTLSGDTLRVARGDYVEQVDFSGKSLRIVGTGGPVRTRIIAPPGMRAVLVTNGEGPHTELRGLTVTGGEGSSADFGNGIRVVGANLILNRVHLRDNGTNAAFPPVAGLYAQDSVIRIESSLITSNGHTDAFGAGGAHLVNCTTHIRSSTFSENRGDPAGGLYVEAGVVVLESTLFLSNTTNNSNAAGMHVSGATATLTGCRFEQNFTHFDGYVGGGLHVSSGAVRVVDTDFVGNRSAHGGGASVTGGSVSFRGCSFVENEARVTSSAWDGSGGALAAGVGVSVERCFFTGNRAEGGCGCASDGLGAALFGPIDAEQCTFLGNQAAVAGGAAYGAATLVNSIAWGNLPDQLAGGAGASWSDVQGGAAGTGNIAVDPLFLSEKLPDLHLRPNSPCIDAGDPTSPRDDDGSVTDMGVFPFDAGYIPEPSTYCTAKINSQGCAPGIGFSGLPTLGGADDFFITADKVLGGQFGLLIWGPDPNSMPLFGGTLCVGSFVRTPVVASGGNPGGGDCSGTLSFHMSQAYMAGHGVGEFTTLFAQWWYRDPGFSSPDNAGLTDGLAFLVVP